MNLLRYILIFGVFLTLQLGIHHDFATNCIPEQAHSHEQISSEIYGKGHAVEIQSGFKVQTARSTNFLPSFASKQPALIHRHKFEIACFNSGFNFSNELRHFPDYFQSVDIIFPFHTFW